MMNIRLRYIKAYRDRHGKPRYYLRRPGFKTVALPSPAGSPEFMAAYTAAGGRGEFPTSGSLEVWTRQTRSGLRKSYIYIAGSDHPSGDIKIGTSAKPKQRVSDLQTANSRKLRILAKFVGDKTTEAAVHRLLCHSRIRGEWFRRSKAVEQFIEEVRRGTVLNGMLLKDEPEPPELDEWDERLADLEEAKRLGVSLDVILARKGKSRRAFRVSNPAHKLIEDKKTK
jgi:hypothetical protein